MNFDLNIENYNENELLDMFGLTRFYDKNMLDINETKIIDNINSNNKINQEVKSKTISFIVKAKNILLANVNNIGNESSLLDKINGVNISKSNNAVQSKINEIYNLNTKLIPTQLENPQEHMVQTRETRPYIASRPKEYLPGIINPLKKETFRQYLNIDSKFRDNYYGTSSTNFFMALPVNLNKVLTMQLMSIELPTTYYVISKQFGNNFFTLIVEDEKQVISIPNGNYSTTGILNYLNVEMQKLGGNFQYITFNVNIDSNNDGSNQMIISIDPTQNLTLSLDFQSNALGGDDRNTPLPLKLGWKLGFRNGIYENSTTYVSEGLIDLSGPKYMYLAIDDYNNNVSNSFYSAFTSSILNNNNVLARISLTSQPYTVFCQNNFNLTTITFRRIYYGPVNIKNLTVQLLDEYGRIVDLNNMDYSFCLTFETAYDI